MKWDKSFKDEHGNMIRLATRKTDSGKVINLREAYDGIMGKRSVRAYLTTDVDYANSLASISAAARRVGGVQRYLVQLKADADHSKHRHAFPIGKDAAIDVVLKQL
jgi:hypothetical protein